MDQSAKYESLFATWLFLNVSWEMSVNLPWDPVFFYSQNYFLSSSDDQPHPAHRTMHSLPNSLHLMNVLLSNMLAYF